MPTISRSRTLPQPAEEVWRLLSDPEQLPRWWPSVRRVEDISAGAWTLVLASPRGKTVRADYSLEDSQPLERLVWRHEVDESPFERILRESTLELALEPAGEGATNLELTARHRPRGFARFGGFQIRRASRRQLDEALDGLEHIFGVAA